MGYAASAAVAVGAALAVELWDQFKQGRFDGRRPSDAELIRRLRAVVQRRRPGLLRGVRIFPSSCSFCENRSRVYLRTRRADGTPYDEHLLLYVLLHELAHVVTAGADNDTHGPAFQASFGDILASFPELADKRLSAPEDYTHSCSRR